MVNTISQRRDATQPQQQQITLWSTYIKATRAKWLQWWWIYGLLCHIIILLSSIFYNSLVCGDLVGMSARITTMTVLWQLCKYFLVFLPFHPIWLTLFCVFVTYRKPTTRANNMKYFFHFHNPCGNWLKR